MVGILNKQEIPTYNKFMNELDYNTSRLYLKSYET